MNEKNLLVALMALLERENTVSIPQLARLLNVSEERVWDALEVLVFCYDSVSMRLDLHSAYASLEKSGTERLLRLNREETGILLDALEAQGFSANDELCEKLLQTKGFLEGEDSNGGTPSTRPPQAPIQIIASGSEEGIAEVLAAACDDPRRHLLAIKYQKEGAEGPEERMVEPYALVSREDRLYLHAYCRTASGWRSFRADRIKSATVLDASFDPCHDEPDWDADMQEGGTMAHVRIMADTELPAWPGLGRATLNSDGTRDVEVRWLGGMWLPKRIVALQGNAVPLNPPELVRKTRAYAQSLLA